MRVLLFLLMSLCSTLSAYELSIVSMFRNTAPYLKEWVEYHHMVGVDHFWLYNDASDDNWEEVLSPYIEQGLVEVIYWPASKPDWVPRQIASFQDGLMRGLGTSTWVALIDQDEFLLPMKEKTIPETLRKYFAQFSAVYINWRNFGTSHVTLSPGECMLSRLTSCSPKNHSRNRVGKTIVRPECVEINSVYYPHHFPLKPGATYVDGDGGTTVTASGIDWFPDRHSHTNYLRINHYIFRDENYFHQTKVPRDSNLVELLKEQYKQFNSKQDFAILEFMKKYHPKMYAAFWQNDFK